MPGRTCNEFAERMLWQENKRYYHWDGKELVLKNVRMQ